MTDQLFSSCESSQAVKLGQTELGAQFTILSSLYKDCIKKSVLLCKEGCVNKTFSSNQFGLCFYIKSHFAVDAYMHLLSFQEILLAEKWAKMNKLPFPKIDPNVFDREGMKECYVFKPKDSSSEKDCPTIIHFVLANINFRKYKAPGEHTVFNDRSSCSFEAL